MSNICNGQQQQANDNNSKTDSLTPSVYGYKMIPLFVLLLFAATLLASPATSIETASASNSPLAPRPLKFNPLTKRDEATVQQARGSLLRQRQRQHQQRAARSSPNITADIPAQKMQHPGHRKRSSQVLNHKLTSSTHSKRFRGSLEEETFVGGESALSSSNSSTSARRNSNNDVNNNNNQIITSIQDDNNNNNSVHSLGRTRHISSLNGTIDLSRYEQDDVDRLYSDALLVYVKNFNETLPVRREMLSFGGNRTSRVPTYRSDARMGGSNDWPES